MPAVYTRTGDKGTTALFGGSRVPKQSIRVSAYGSVDEANAFIGAAKVQMADDELRDFVHHVGHRLFVLGSELASDSEGRAMLIGMVNDEDITEMEALIDKCMAFCGPQRAFVVPGTEATSAALHIARTAVRRAERMVLTLSEHEEVRPEAIKYLNRLSDALYAIARVYEVRFELKQIEAQVRAKVAAGSTELSDSTPTGSSEEEGMTTDNKVPSGPPWAVCPPPNWIHEYTPSTTVGSVESGQKLVAKQPESPVSSATKRYLVPTLDLVRCRLAGDTALRLARAKGVRITFAAVDQSGVPIMVQRDDDAPFVSVQMAQDKAYTAASMRMPTRDLGPLLADGGHFQGLHTSHGGRITAIGGGMPVFIQGTFVGAMAVSGGALDEDLELVTKALEAIGATSS
ncbi:cob(I)yrinic acid a,c-diamide adenosyltransferase [Stomatohabitans albus]|uniref:cob(I)yrinic acid a,c-diamide adenosyltransferase n=1 Tax=Stomatohabitans albus TaxID=3110766 RepID=UPI00300C0B5F